MRSQHSFERDLPFDACPECYELHQLAIQAIFYKKVEAEKSVAETEEEFPHLVQSFDKYRERFSKQDKLVKQKAALEEAIEFAKKIQAEMN